MTDGDDTNEACRRMVFQKQAADEADNNTSQSHDMAIRIGVVSSQKHSIVLPSVLLTGKLAIPHSFRGDRVLSATGADGTSVP